MLLFNDIPEAYVDAESEAEFSPDNITYGFFDFKQHYSQLINMSGPKCFISGRKGTGKTAYIYRINQLENSILLNLDKLPYKQLKKVSDPKTDSHLKYTSIWQLLIINYIVNHVDINQISSGTSQYNQILKILNLLGFGDNITTNIKTASKKTLSFNVLKQSGNFESESIVKIHSIFDLVDKLVQLFKEISFTDSLYLLVDGVDDVLLDRKDKTSISEILSSLFTVIYDTNLSSKRSQNNFKIIMAVRSDIWGLVNGPDMNKRSQTNKLSLEWISGNEQEELAHLINHRLSISPKIKDFVESQGSTFALWNNFFPSDVKLSKNADVSSWKYFLEYSLYRPRDVIKFVDMARESFSNSSSLSKSEFKKLVARFSKEYFFDEMRNEMVGFVEDKILDDLTEALQYIGRDSFKLPDFLRAFRKIDESFTDDQIKLLLNELFDHGYIGQRSGDYESYTFKHKALHQKINYSNSLVIHRGLYAAVAINK